MPAPQIPYRPLPDFVRPMIALPAWGARKGHGSFLTLEFGEPAEARLRQRAEKGVRGAAHLRGQWHLWIYCCHWRLTQAGKPIAWSEDSGEAIGRAAAALNGRILTSVTLEPGRGRSSFIFELQGVLDTWPYGDDPSERQWLILTAAEALAYRADGTFAREDARRGSFDALSQ